MSKKILISTDIGSDCDDALSILASINSGLNICGIHTVNGDVKTRAYITRHLVNLAGKDIPIYVGEKNPIKSPSEPYTNYEDFHVVDQYIDEEASTGSSEIVYLDPSSVGIREDSVSGLEEALSEGSHDVFSIGPMTNIARLLLKNYDVRKNISRLYVMGCRFSNGGKLGHNVRYDVDAARIVLGSDIPITVIPGDLCNKWRMPVSHLDGLKSAAGLYVKKMVESHLGIRTSQALNTVTGREINISFYEKLLCNSEFIKALGEKRINLIDSIRMIIYGVESPWFFSNRLRERSGSEAEKEFGKAKNLIELFNGNHFTPEDAAFDPDKFFREYFSVIKRLREREPIGFRFGELSAEMLQGLVPVDLSVSDLYVPFCYLHPESIKAEKGNVVVDDLGATRRIVGDRLDIVTEVDINSFKKFIDKNLK